MSHSGRRTQRLAGSILKAMQRARQINRSAMANLISSFYAPSKRAAILTTAAGLIALVAVLDWETKPNFALSFLYLFPIMLAAGFLSRWYILGLSVFCAVLGELFGSLPAGDATTRMAMMSLGFTGTGWFVSELVHGQRRALGHLQELTEQIHHREDAERQVRVLVESSPAAIVIVDDADTISLANEAAQHLFTGVDGRSIVGESLRDYLPALQSVASSPRARAFRTSMHCKGQRQNGEVFLAAVWFSTYGTSSGSKLAAIVVDLSEDLRDREDLSLNYLLKNARILAGAMSHEIRNLCGAIALVARNLARVKELRNNPDLEALKTLVDGVEKVASLELQGSAEEPAITVDVATVLDELRVLIEPLFRDSEILLKWEVAQGLPLVWADEYGLLQVFLNLARNSGRAMQRSDRKLLTVAAAAEAANVVIRFEDTGVGVRSPDDLFRPFQPGADGTGLGLYVSRAILHSFHGELRYETRQAGCCFAVVLTQAAA